MKKCIKCDRILNIEEFPTRKDSKDGHRNSCNDCYKTQHRISSINYRLENKESLNKYNKEYAIKKYYEDSEKYKLKSVNYRKSNKNKVSNYNKEYREINKEKISTQRKEYREINKEKIREYNKSYSKFYRKNNITIIWRGILSDYLRRIKKNKIGKTQELLKYSPIQLKQRIECQFKNGMSWKNHGEWHIDHKKPITRFNKDSKPDIVNSLCNLQPLWAKDNLAKKNKFHEQLY